MHNWTNMEQGGVQVIEALRKIFFGDPSMGP
jgi:hypothetical protein